MGNRTHLKNKKRIVVKIGSSSITHKETGHISLTKMEKLVRQIADLKHSGRDVILVSSGAQAVGINALNLKEKPKRIEQRQAVASVGQASLMMIYQKLFREYNVISSQVLITKDLIDRPHFKQNAVNTFKALIDYGVIPIVNENDTIATEEIEFGDNDTLSAIVAEIVEADLLILLSDINGLYNTDPNKNDSAKLIDEVSVINDEILLMATGTDTLVGTGGMVTKLQAAKMATRANIEMVIAHSDKKHVLEAIINGEQVGTLFKV